MMTRHALLAIVALAGLVLAPPLNAGDLSCQGIYKPGGVILCDAPAGTGFESDGFQVKANAQGRVIIGFDRDAPLTETVKVTRPDGQIYNFDIRLEKRNYDMSYIDGLPPSQVSSFTEQQLARIKASSARKKTGFQSHASHIGLEDGFDYPLKDFTKTSPFGAQRILNGEPGRPHYGIDMAAPEGTPIYAPADGVTSFADDDLYFEGAMVMLDHGQGLNSIYLHVSEIFVKVGQMVKKGDKIAAVGSKGRSTGPHVCWRLKWQNRNLDPELLTKWPNSSRP